MEEKNIISIAGVNHGDIAYYLAKLLATSNEPVLCADMSRDGEIFNTIDKMDGAKEVYVRNLTYAYNVAFVKKGTYDNFKYIVIYHGKDIDKNWFDNSGVKIIISDFDKYHVQAMEKALADVDKSEVYLATTDHYSRKVSVDRLIGMLGIEKDSVLNTFELPYEFEDKAAFIAWHYNGSQKVAGLSKDMKNELKEIYYSIVEKEPKANFAKVIKQAG